MSWSIGLDIGGTKVLGVLLDGAAAVRATARASTRPGADGVLAAATEVVERLCADADLAPSALYALQLEAFEWVNEYTHGVQ